MPPNAFARLSWPVAKTPVADARGRSCGAASRTADRAKLPEPHLPIHYETDPLARARRRVQRRMAADSLPTADCDFAGH